MPVLISSEQAHGPASLAPTTKSFKHSGCWEPDSWSQAQLECGKDAVGAQLPATSICVLLACACWHSASVGAHPARYKFKASFHSQGLLSLPRGLSQGLIRSSQGENTAWTELGVGRVSENPRRMD